MISVQKAIFPGFALGCILLVLMTHLIASPPVGLAAGPVTGLLPIVTVVPKPGSDADQRLAAAEPADVEAQPVAAIPADPDCSLSPQYPQSIQQWCGLIDRYARENQLDSNLVAAVMLQESGGNAQAYSVSGAVGLMQVMPRDGLASNFMCINGPCFAARPSMDELSDPEYNISYGTRMLAGLIGKHGDVREALRAYGPINMGYHYADLVLGILNRYQ